MNFKQVHKNFVTGRAPLVVAVILFILFRFIGTNGDGVVVWSTAAIQLATAFLLLYLTQTFVIIRNRTFLPAFFYLLFTGTIPNVFGNLVGSVSAVCVLLCVFFLFSSYLQERSQAHALNIALLLTLGSFLWTPLLYFGPLFLYGMYQLRSLNFRSFFAGLIGFLVIYLFIFTWSFHKEDLSIFFRLFPDWQVFIQIHSLKFNLWEYLVLGFLIGLFFLSGGGIFASSISEKVKTIMALRFLYTACFLVFILFLLQSEWKREWYSILCAPLSLLISHLFTLTNKKIIRWLMLATILFFLGIFIFLMVEK